MTLTRNWLGLSSRSETILAVGISVFIGCLGIRIIKAPNLSLKVANTQLITSGSASRLEELAKKLDAQAAIIEQKDAAYAQLEKVYKLSLKGKKSYGKLQQAIEAVEAIPPVEDINYIQSEIELTEAALKDVNRDRLQK